MISCILSKGTVGVVAVAIDQYRSITGCKVGDVGEAIELRSGRCAGDVVDQNAQVSQEAGGTRERRPEKMWGSAVKRRRTEN